VQRSDSISPVRLRCWLEAEGRAGRPSPRRPWARRGSARSGPQTCRWLPATSVLERGFASSEDDVRRAHWSTLTYRRARHPPAFENQEFT
jgi:hypothetical protein